MNVVRTGQMQEMGRAIRARHVRQLSDILAARFTGLAAEMGTEQFEVFVDRCVAKAEQHGLVSPYATSRYVMVCCALGERFEDDERYPWAAIILAAKNLTPDGRAGRLVDWTQRTLSTESNSTGEAR